MVTSKKLIASFGVVAGLGAAMLPLTTYATDPSDTSDAMTVRVGVADTLSVSATETYATSGKGTDTEGDYIAVEQGEENVNTLTHTVTVAGTTYNDYTLSMYASDGNSGKLVHTETDSAYFSPLASSATSLSAGTWGFQYKDNQATTPAYNGSWLPVGTSASSMTTIHSDDSAKHTAKYEETYEILYGVSAAENQLAGIYEAEVTYYATATSSL